MKKLFKKFTNLLLIFTTLFNTVASPLTVFASVQVPETPSKGDIKLEEDGVTTQYGTQIGDSVTTTGGSLTSQGDVKITKKVTKKTDTGLYTVEITVEGVDYKTEQTTPIYTIFVLDASYSMNGTPWTNAKTAAINFSNTLVTNYNQNKIALITFNSSTQVNSDFDHFVKSDGTTRAFVDSDFGSIYNGTNYYKGLEPAYNMVNNLKTTKPNAIVNVIFISDGDPTKVFCSTNCSDYEISGSNYASLIKAKGAKLYTLAYNISSTSNAYKLLQGMSSSGEVIPTTSGDINSKLQSIATEITKTPAASNASVTDKLGSDFTFVDSDTNTSGVTSNNGVVSYNIGKIEEDKTYTFQFDIQVNVNTADGWVFTNDTSDIKVTEDGKVLASIDKSAEVYWEPNSYDYKIEYYYNGDHDNDKDEVKNATYGTSISSYPDKNIPGYKLEKVETTESTTDKTLPLVVGDDTSKNIIKVYYVKDTFNYTVEYYYNGVQDTTLTENKTALFESEINTYTDKVKDGYKLEKVETLETDKTLPLKIGIDETKNVIRVYYITDDEQTKDLSYTVKYYKNGVLQESDTQVKTTTVQFLQPDTMTVVKTEINTTNKYYGYKLDKTNPTTIPDTINNGGVIEVYYVIDEDNTKDLSYTVEYYKDGELQENDTQTETTTVQVLEPDTMTVDKTKINITNKYGGYRLDSTNPTSIPNIIEDGGVIKVYYVKDNFNYTIEYYYDGNIDNNKTETKSALFESEITTYADKNITGYRLEKVETTETSNNTLPLIISSNPANNVIKVYYVKQNYGYKVEYYYDNVLDDSKTYTASAEYKSIINSYPSREKTGYSFQKTENLPLTIDVNTESNIIKVYYVSNIYNYTIYHVEKENTTNILDTHNGSSNFGSSITVNQKTFEGFTYDSKDKETIVIDTDNNVAYVYYTRNSYDYTIYHVEKDNENNILDTEANNADYEDVIEVNQKTFEGFTYDSKDKETIVIDTDNNVAYVYYTRNSYDYTIYHLEKDNETNILETESNSADYEDVINVVEKDFTGFTYDSKDKETIVIDTDNNVAYVYYTRNSYDYTIYHVEKDNENNILDTESNSADYEDVIKVNEKDFTGFTYDSKDKETIVIDTENNVAYVYYTRNSYNYTIYHVEKDNENNILDTESNSADYEDVIKVNEKDFTGFTYDSKDKETIVIDTDNNVAYVYYTRNSYDYTIYHVEKDNENNILDTESNSADYEDVIKVNEKDFTGFTYDSKDKETIVIDTDNNVAYVYYTRNSYNYTIYHVEKDNENNILETESNSADYEDVINVVEKDFTGFTYDSKDKESIEIDTENNVAYVYYTRNNYKYTVEYYKENLEGEFEIVEEDTKVYENVLFESETTYEVNEYEGFTYDETKTINAGSKVPANNDLVIRLYYTLDESEVIVHYVVKVEDNYIPFDVYGRDEFGNNTPDFAGIELEDSIFTGKIGSEFTTIYRVVPEYTLVGIYNGNILNETNLEKLEGAEITSTIEVNTKEYTYVYEAPMGDYEELPPQTGLEQTFNYINYIMLLAVVYILKKYFKLINTK